MYRSRLLWLRLIFGVCCALQKMWKVTMKLVPTVCFLWSVRTTSASRFRHPWVSTAVHIVGSVFIRSYRAHRRNKWTSKERRCLCVVWTVSSLQGKEQENRRSLQVAMYSPCRPCAAMYTVRGGGTAQQCTTYTVNNKCLCGAHFVVWILIRVLDCRLNLRMSIRLFYGLGISVLRFDVIRFTR